MTKKVSIIGVLGYKQVSQPVFTWTYNSTRFGLADHQAVALAANVFLAWRRRPYRLQQTQPIFTPSSGNKSTP